MPEYTLCSSITKPKNKIVVSSDGITQYTLVLSTPTNDASCTCPGFTYNGKCKHITAAEESRCRWSEQGYSDGECPLCEGPTEHWNPEPEYI